MPTHKVRVFDRQKSMPIRKDVLKHAAVDVLSEADGPTGVNVAVVDDARIRDLNARFLGEDSATDVLAFPADGPLPDEDIAFLGDVAVSADKALDMAGRYGHTPQEELVLYVVHGLLHLLGYDDTAPSDARRMRLRERHYMERYRAWMLERST